MSLLIFANGDLKWHYALLGAWKNDVLTSSSCKQKIPIQLHVYFLLVKLLRSTLSIFCYYTLVVICEEPIPEISCSAPNLTNCYAIMRNLLMV